LFSKSKPTLPRRRTQEASLQTLTAPPQSLTISAADSQPQAEVKTLPSSASFIAEDLDRAFAGFRRKFHVNDDEEEEDDDEPVSKQDLHSTLARKDMTLSTLTRSSDPLARSSRPFEDLPSAAAAAATAASVIERAAAAALGFDVPKSTRTMMSSSNVPLSSNSSIQPSGSRSISLNLNQNKASQPRSDNGKASRRKKGEPESVPMSVALQGMAEQLDMQMLCMSRRLATFSGDSELLQPAVATFKATIGSEDSKASEKPVVDKETLQRASVDLKDEVDKSIVSVTPLDQSSSLARPPLPTTETSLRASKRTDLQDLRRSWEQLSASSESDKTSRESKTVKEQAPSSSMAHQPIPSQQDEASSRAASEATAMFMPSDSSRSTRRNPSAAWFDAVSSAMRGDVQGTLAALEEKTAAEMQELAALEELEKTESLRKIHEEAGEASALARAPRLDLTLQPEGRLSPDFELSLKARWQGSQAPLAPSVSSSSRVLLRPQPPLIFPVPEKDQTVKKVPQPPSSVSPAPPLTLPTTAAEAAAETAAFLSSLGPALGSVPFDLKSELSLRASASGAALESSGPSKGVPLGPKASAASSFIPLTAFIPPVVRPRAIYGPDGRISLVSGTDQAPDPYQSLAVAAAAEGRPLFPNGPGNESKSALFDFSAIQAQALDGSARFRSSVSASDLRNLPTLPLPPSSASSASQTNNFSSTFAATSRAALPAQHTLPSYVSPQGDLPPPPISPPLGFFGFAGQPPATQDLYRQLERYFMEELKVPPTTQTAFSGNFQKTWPTHSLPPNLPVSSFGSRPPSQVPSAIASPARSVRQSKHLEPSATSSLSAEVDRLLHEHRDLEKRTLESWAGREGSSALSGTGGIRDRPRLSVPTSFYSPQSEHALHSIQRAQEALERLHSVRAAIAIDQHLEYNEEGSGYVDLQG